MLKEIDLNHKALHGKIIIVTGASQGIGRQASIHYAQNGATVILLARNVKGLESTYDTIIEKGGEEPVIFPLDLATAGPEQYQQLTNATKEQFGRLDGILHNASMLGELTPIEYYNPQKWQEVIQVNLNAPFLLTKSCLSLLKQTHRAAIIFTSSHFPNKSKAYWGAYAAAKQGLIALMQTLVEELSSQKIYINMVNPGPVRSPLRSKAYPAEEKDLLFKPKDLMPIYLKLIQAYRYHLKGRIIDAQYELSKAHAVPEGV